MISACEKGPQWQLALVLLEEMRGLRLEPNVIAFNAVISACSKGQRCQLALGLLEDMERISFEKGA